MMSRIDFMNELESLLSDIPIDEKEEALQYYNGYFEDAGEDHEEEIMKELVSPQRIAKIIKAELDANAVDREDRGYFTEKGYQDTIYKDEKFELVGTAKNEAGKQYNENTTGNIGSEHELGSNNRTYQNNQQQNNQQQYNQQQNNQQQNNQQQNNQQQNNQQQNNQQQNNQQQNNQQQNNQQQNNQQHNKQNENTGLIILLCIIAIPVGLPFLGIMIGVVAAIFGIIIGFGIAGITMMVVGIALFISGLIQISAPFTGLLLCGVGLIVLGLGMLFSLVSTLLCKNVLPAMVRGFVNICRLPFKNRSVTA